MGDYLAESLTAQSLDLPPAAARWRQSQRSDGARSRRLVVWEVDEVEDWQEEQEEPGGLAGLLRVGAPRRREVNLRQRVRGVLARDREEAWAGSLDEDQQRRQQGGK